MLKKFIDGKICKLLKVINFLVDSDKEQQPIRSYKRRHIFFILSCCVIQVYRKWQKYVDTKSMIHSKLLKMIHDWYKKKVCYMWGMRYTEKNSIRMSQMEFDASALTKVKT